VANRLSAVLPFAIAIFLPPAGLILGLVELQQDRQMGARLIAVALLAALVWVLLFAG
jgi:hypothetical protein